MTEAKMTGGPELIAFMGAFSTRLQNGALRVGMVAGAKPVRNDARARAKKKTGKMAKAIRSGSPRVNKDGTVSITISLRNKGKPTNDHAFLGVIWEGGSKAYEGKVIVRGGATRQRSKKVHAGGGKVFGLYPKIAAHAAHPFMAPALEAKASEAINAIGTRIREYLRDKASFTAPVTIEAEN